MSWLFKEPLPHIMRGNVVFLSPIPGEIRLLLLIAGVLLVLYLYRRVRTRVSARALRWLTGVRLAILSLAVLILGQPAVRTYDAGSSSVFTAVVVDTSRSMAIADASPAGDRTRFAAAAEVLEGNADVPGLLAVVATGSRPLIFRFDSAAARVESLTALEPDGPHTDLFRSVRQMEGELRAVPLAAVVLLTDGCSNQGGSPEDAARLLQHRGVPLHVVGVGNPAPPRDCEVVDVAAPRRVRRNTAVELTVTVRHTGFSEAFPLRILRDDAVLTAETVQPIEGSDLRRIRLSITPDHEGTAVYRAEIPVADGETVRENNVREFSIDIRDDRLPVLYLEGSPRLEYRFLRRAMFRDPNFRVVGLLRLGNGRFYVQGADESEMDLVDGFPRTPEALFRYQALILGDIEASYFTAEQLALVEAFVRERGGGLLMLGGVNSFGAGRYAGTPVERLLPVGISTMDPSYSDEHYASDVAETARDHPVMQLVPDPDQNRRLWRALPDLIGISPVQGTKRGASLLVVDRTAGRPVLAVQNYGAGRVAAFTSGGSWYWQVSMPASDEFHEKFWKQLVRWLVIGARDHLTVSMDAETYARRSPVHVEATVLHRNLQPNNDAEVVARITDPLGNSDTVRLDWILSREGVYQCRYSPADVGQYTVEVTVKDMDMAPVTTGFLVTEPLVEFSNAGLKRELLRRLCDTTGGVYVEYPDVEDLRDRLAADARACQEAAGLVDHKPIWDMPFLYILMLALCAAEWIVRRRMGLA